MRGLPEPGHGPAGFLRHAVLIERRITIGGVALDVTAPAFCAPFLAALGPFLDPAPFDRRVTLQIGTWTEAPGSTITYRRPGLWFAGGDARCTAGIDDTVGSFEAALQLALEQALLFAGGLVVHASAGVVGGAAWLMPGRSGTGKSTAAREAGFDAVLSDEMCVVRRTADGVEVAGTPFWSEGRTLPLNPGRAPLGVLARLIQDARPAIAPIEAADAAAFLLGAVTLYRHAPDARAAAFETACAIAEAARCVALRFPKEGPWLSAVRAGASGASSPKPWRRPSP